MCLNHAYFEQVKVLFISPAVLFSSLLNVFRNFRRNLCINLKEGYTGHGISVAFIVMTKCFNMLIIVCIQG